jgi:NADPH:quinone reductase-like Zn-dependent oxidoreductase
MTERDAASVEVASSMKALRLHAPGGIDGLRLEQVPVPALHDGDALVRVHAASITRDELDWPTDRLPAIPSYELSGVVVEVGSGAEGVSVGDEVYALSAFDRDGVAAEYAAVPAALLAPKPRTLDHVEAAALPLAGLSAWQGVFDHGHLAEGQRVLVTGAAGGVGHLATQLARERGAYVIGSTSSAGSTVLGAGADEVLDAGSDLDALEPVDLVFDTAGGETLARSPTLVRPGGRLVSIAEEPPATHIESTYFIVEPSLEQLVELARLVDEGKLRPEVDSVYPLEEARAAFERSFARGKRGKVVLRIA